MSTDDENRSDAGKPTNRSSGAASRKIIPNRNTIAVKPYKHVEMTKSEMYEMLRKAVENTK
jgi:hypothetical protein